MILIRVFAAIMACAALASCAAPSREPTAEAPPAVDAPYRLANGDRLRILVFGQADLTNTYAVDSSGVVSMPLIGRVRAQGLTTAELERAVTARFRQGYLRDPSVSIEVQDFRPVFVLGAVACAGQYPYVNGMTVEQAVAAAGGFTPLAAQASVSITRIAGGRATTFSAPLDYPARPGDTIAVDGRLF